MLSYKELEARDQIEELEDVLEFLKVKMDKRKDKGRKPKKKHVKKALIAEYRIDMLPNINMLHTGTLKDLEKADRRDEIESMFENQDVSYRDQKDILEMLFGED